MKYNTEKQEITSRMRTGESAPSWRSSPETQSRATAPSSFVLRHSRRNLTSGTDRKNDAKIVSTCRFHPITGNTSYGRFRVLNAGRYESRPPPSTSSDGSYLRWPPSSIAATLKWIFCVRTRSVYRPERGLKMVSGGVTQPQAGLAIAIFVAHGSSDPMGGR